MARRKTTEQLVEEAESNGQGTAVIDAAPKPMEEGEQVEMFPELDMSKPEEKEAYHAARAYRTAKAERDEILTTCKAKVDAARQRLVDAMGVLKRDKFTFEGVKAEIIPGKAKVRVVAEEEEDESDEDEGDE